MAHGLCIFFERFAQCWGVRRCLLVLVSLNIPPLRGGRRAKRARHEGDGTASEASSPRGRRRAKRARHEGDEGRRAKRARHEGDGTASEASSPRGGWDGERSKLATRETASEASSPRGRRAASEASSLHKGREGRILHSRELGRPKKKQKKRKKWPKNPKNVQKSPDDPENLPKNRKKQKKTTELRLKISTNGSQKIPHQNGVRDVNSSFWCGFGAILGPEIGHY